jgi:hypothetical protein
MTANSWRVPTAYQKPELIDPLREHAGLYAAVLEYTDFGVMCGQHIFAIHRSFLKELFSGTE